MVTILSVEFFNFFFFSGIGKKNFIIGFLLKCIQLFQICSLCRPCVESKTGHRHIFIFTRFDHICHSIFNQSVLTHLGTDTAPKISDFPKENSCICCELTKQYYQSYMQSIGQAIGGQVQIIGIMSLLTQSLFPRG